MARWLQLIRKKSSFRICPSCGFDKIRKEDNYCMMCGVDLRNERNKGGKSNGKNESRQLN